MFKPEISKKARMWIFLWINVDNIYLKVYCDFLIRNQSVIRINVLGPKSKQDFDEVLF